MKQATLLYDPAWFGGEETKPSPLQLDANRQAYLEYLYERDGRHDPGHPMHSLYTGLAQDRRAELVKLHLDGLGALLMGVQVDSFHENPKAAPYFEAYRHAAPAKAVLHPRSPAAEVGDGGAAGTGPEGGGVPGAPDPGAAVEATSAGAQ